MAKLSHYEREQIYRTFDRLLASFRRDDVALARAQALALSDGFGSGGDGGSRSKGDHSDPTGCAVIQRWDLGEFGSKRADPAGLAFDALREALAALGKADVARRRALPPNPAEEPPEFSEGLPRRVSKVDETWCSSCARVKRGKLQLIFNPRSSRSGGRRDLCTWCQDEWLASGEPGHRRDPDERLVMLHEYLSHTGGHMTEARRREALSLSVKECRKRYLDIHERSAQIGA